MINKLKVIMEADLYGQPKLLIANTLKMEDLIVFKDENEKLLNSEIQSRDYSTSSVQEGRNFD